MSEIKRYKGTHLDTGFEVVVEIDSSVMTEEKLHEINNFWSGAEDRLDDADGIVVNAVLKMLSAEVFRLSIDHMLVEECFDWKCRYTGKQRNGIEGWPEMDGSFGIKIVSYDDFEIRADDIGVEVLR